MPPFESPVPVLFHESGARTSRTHALRDLAEHSHARIIGDSLTHKRTRTARQGRGFSSYSRRLRVNASCRCGMTMVEILAVVVILGLVATVLLAGFSGSFGKAKRELAKSGIGVLAGKLEIYKIEHDAWPTNELGLAVLSDGHAMPTISYYVNPDQLLDPWNRPYLFVRPGPAGHPYEIISYGADGQPGGDGEDADVSSTALREKDRGP